MASPYVDDAAVAEEEEGDEEEKDEKENDMMEEEGNEDENEDENEEEDSENSEDEVNEDKDDEEETMEDDNNDSHNEEDNINEPSTSKGCDAGFYGSFCKQSCPVHCKNGVCNKDSGQRTGRRKRKNDDSPKRKTKTCRQTVLMEHFGSTGCKEREPTSSGTDEDEESDKGNETLDMSFYKLRWFTLKNNKDSNVKEVIRENFKPTRKGDELSLKWEDAKNKYGDFHILFYRRKTLRPTAKRLPSVESDENIRHEDLIFFFTADVNPQQAFCLCSGRSFTLLEGHTESKFSKTMAKHFMDGNSIISKEVICIAGPSISEHQTFSREAVLLIRGHYEKIITGLTAEIREGTELAKIICDGKSVSMALGQKKLKINKKLDLKTFSKVLSLFIDVNKSPDAFTNDPVMVAALDHTQCIGDQNEVRKYDENLMEDALKGSEQMDVYLSHRKVEDWVHSYDIKLLCLKKEMKRWTSPPTFDTLRKACKLPDDHDQIQIVFTAKDKSEVKGNLKQFLHGSTMCENERYYKVAGKWFWLSTKYRDMLANRMAIFLQSNLIKQGKTGYLPLPWKPRSPPEITDAFEFLSQITRDKLFDWLKNKKVVYLGKDEISCLTGLNCKFIKSTSVFAELKTCLTPPTKKDEKKGPPKKADKEFNVLPFISGVEHLMMESAETAQPLFDCIKSCSLKAEVKKVLEEKKKEIVQILQKEREVINSRKEVGNPNVTKDLSEAIFKEFFNTSNCTPEVIRKEVLCYLRTSCKKIAEEDYNETYQTIPIPQKDDGSFYMLGDRVQGNVLPELFDVLYFKKGKDSAKLYLYHVKEGFGPKTRDACSQIRVSANLLWHDLMDSSCRLPNVMKYRKFALEYNGDDICRIMLKQAMENITDDKFKGMLRGVSDIVYVYAFMDFDKPDNYLDNASKIGKLTKQNVDDCEVQKLKMEGYVDRDGTLTDSAFLTTKDSFEKQMKGKLPAESVNKLYEIFSKQSKKNPSTIALVELTTLAEEFTKFQCSARRFSLKVCQISTCKT